MADFANDTAGWPTQWADATRRLAEADARMEKLNGPDVPSNDEMDGAGEQYGAAIYGLLRCPAPDGEALKHKLRLLLTKDDTDEPLEFHPADRDAILADVDRLMDARAPVEARGNLGALAQEVQSRANEIEAVIYATIDAANEEWGTAEQKLQAESRQAAMLHLAERLARQVAELGAQIERATCG